ncbi:hypothetical protein K8I85_07720 [bacterium]|nr:hypothetical protein [bacterium]
MRSTRWILGVVLAGVALPLLAAEPLTVQVRETKLRMEPKFWARAIETLHAGDAVSEVSRQDAWVLAGAPSGKRGWLHESAVTHSDVKLSGGSRTASGGASADEVALAGKGFTEEVEQAYRGSHADGFAALDALPPAVDDARLESFLKQGKLADWAKR